MNQGEQEESRRFFESFESLIDVTEKRDYSQSHDIREDDIVGDEITFGMEGFREPFSDSKWKKVFCDDNILLLIFSFAGIKDCLHLSYTCSGIFKRVKGLAWRKSSYFTVHSVKNTNFSYNDDTYSKFCERHTSPYVLLFLNFEWKVRRIVDYSNRYKVNIETWNDDWNFSAVTTESSFEVLELESIVKFSYVGDCDDDFVLFRRLKLFYHPLTSINRNDRYWFNPTLERWCSNSLHDVMKLNKKKTASSNGFCSEYFGRNSSSSRILYFFKERTMKKLLDLEILLSHATKKRRMYDTINAYEKKVRTKHKIEERIFSLESLAKTLTTLSSSRNRELQSFLLELESTFFQENKEEVNHLLNYDREFIIEAVKEFDSSITLFPSDDDEKSSVYSVSSSSSQDSNEIEMPDVDKVQNQENLLKSESGSSPETGPARPAKSKAGPKNKSLKSDDLEFNGSTDAFERKQKGERLSYYLNKGYNTLEDKVCQISEEHPGVAFKHKLSYVQKPNISITGYYKNGELYEREKKNILMEKKKTAKELLVEKERCRTTVQGLKTRIGTDYGKVAKETRKCKKMYTPHLFSISSKNEEKGRTESVGLLKNPFLIRKEKFLEDDYSLEYVTEHLKYCYFANKRRERGLIFENYVDVKHEINDENSIISIDGVVLEISDESYTLDRKVKFLAGYLRDLIKSKPMGKKGLYPYLYATESMKFFERVECYGSGYEQIWNQYEGKDFFLDISHLKNGLQCAFDEYSFGDPPSLSDKILLKVSDVLKYLPDCAEAREQALSSLHPSSKRTNRERGVQFVVGNPCCSTSEMADLKYQATHRLQYEIMSGKVGQYSDCKVPHMYPEQENIELSLINGRNGDDFLMENLHYCGSNYQTDNHFFLYKFLPVICYFSATGNNDCDGWNDLYCNQLRIMCNEDLFKPGSIVFRDGYDVDFGTHMSFFDQKVNNNFYSHMGDGDSVCNGKIETMIQDIQNNEYQDIVKKMHEEMKTHYSQSATAQELLYKEDYYSDEDFLTLFDCTDRCDYRRDAKDCYALQRFRHYRSISHLKLTKQTVRGGYAKLFDIQNVENVHKSIKWRHYTQRGSTSNWGDIYCTSIKNGKSIERLSPDMMRAHSSFFFYEKIRLDDNVLFTEIDKLPNIVQRELEVVRKVKMKNEGEDEGEEEGDEENDVIMVQETDVIMDTSKWLEYHYPDDEYFNQFREDRIKFIDLMKRFMALYDSINFDVILKNRLKLSHPSILSNFLTSLLPNVSWDKVLYEEQKTTLEELVRILINEKKVILGAEMGWGKTRIYLIAILLLLSNAFVRHVIVSTKKEILYQWIQSFQDICGEKDGMDITVPRMYQYFGMEKKKKKAICEKFLADGGILLCTFESTGEDTMNETIRGLKLKEVNCLQVVDESHYLRSPETKVSKNLRLLSEYSKCYRMHGTGTFHCGDIRTTINQLSVLEGVDFNVMKSRISNLSDLKAYISGFYLRRRLIFEFDIDIYLLKLRMSEKYQKFYKMYCEFKRIRSSGQLVGKDEKWLGITKHHESLNESSNGLDLLLKNSKFPEEQKKELLGTLGLNQDNVGFYSKIANPKLYLFMGYCSNVVSSGLKGLVLLNSIPFLKNLELGSEQLIHQYPNLSEKIFFFHGSLKDSDRKRVISDFKMASTAVLVLSMGVGEAGLDFVNSSLILSLTIPRSPVSFPQLNYRILRRIQRRKCTVLHVVFSMLEIHYYNRFVLPALRQMHLVQDGFELENVQVSDLQTVDISENEFLVSLDDKVPQLIEKVYDVRKYILGNTSSQTQNMETGTD